MKRLSLLISAGIALSTSVLTAQSVDDLLRYSETGALATARSLGTGNVLSSIGADWTAVHANPAGLATYRRSELALTGGAFIPSTLEARVNENVNSVSSSESYFALPHASFVQARRPLGSKWTQLNFGIGLSQNRRFEDNLSYDGYSAGSFTDQLLETSNDFYSGNPYTVAELNEYDEYLAYQVGAIRDEYADGEVILRGALYTSDYGQERLFRQADGQEAAQLRKRGQILRDGHSSSIDLSFAGNYNEKFMIGATLALTRARFDETNRYTESDDRDRVLYFDELTYRRNLSTTGSGIQFRLGGIYRVSQALRIGLAYHSPNVLLIEDQFTTSLRYAYTDGDTTSDTEANSPSAAPLEYTIITPGTFKASVGLVIGKRGLIGAEIGYVNHAVSRIRFQSSDAGSVALQDDLEQAANDQLQAAVQVKVGGELNLQPLQLRAGAEFIGAPVVNEDPAYNFSVGVGYRRGRFGVDLGYQLGFRPERVYQPYRLSPYSAAFKGIESTEVTYTSALNTALLSMTYKIGQ